uniref:Uncharacterized protein n=1 Tax=Arundo donax TaxID=35708 RepID=A0A0A9EHQ8_ARUDO
MENCCTKLRSDLGPVWHSSRFEIHTEFKFVK